MLIYKQEYDSLVDVVKPSEAENVQMGWVYFLGGVTTIMVYILVSTSKLDEKTTQIMVPTNEEMNSIWCCMSPALGVGIT